MHRADRDGAHRGFGKPLGLPSTGLAWHYPRVSLNDAVQALVHLVRVTRDADHESFLAAYEQVTGAKVTRTAEDLAHLQAEQPGPEVFASGTIGEVGKQRWQPPTLDRGALTFYANLPSSKGADFVCVRLETVTGTLSVEVVDNGWFEMAIDLAAVCRVPPASG